MPVQDPVKLFLSQRILLLVYVRNRHVHVSERLTLGGLRVMLVPDLPTRVHLELHMAVFGSNGVMAGNQPEASEVP